MFKQRFIASRLRSAGPSALLGIAALVSLAGCDRKPGGQVAAVVNSEEITQLEIRAEAEAAGMQPGQDFQSYAQPMLNRVIQRNLLADYAKSKNLDRGPEFVARRRQIEQSLLANMAMKQIVSALPAPSPADISNYIQQNPENFGHRERLTLDQVRFAAPSDPQRIKALVALGSLDAVAAKLGADNVPHTRGVTAADTGTLEPAMAQQFGALPNGKPFDLTVNGVTYISAITGRTALPTSASTWTAPATAGFQRQRAQKAIADTMAKLKAKAKIQYDPAFKPAAAAK